MSDEHKALDLSALPDNVNVKIDKNSVGWLVELSVMCHKTELTGSCRARRKCYREATRLAFDDLRQSHAADSAEVERRLKAVGELDWLMK